MTDLYVVTNSIVRFPGNKGELIGIANASDTTTRVAYTKRHQGQLNRGDLVTLEAPAIEGNKPMVKWVHSETQPESFVQAVENNCATKIAVETRLEPGVNIEPGMVEEFGQPIEELEWSGPDRLLTDKHLRERVEVAMAHLKQNGEINEAIMAILLRVMSLLR